MHLETEFDPIRPTLQGKSNLFDFPRSKVFNSIIFCCCLPPGEFEKIEVFHDEPKYPDLRVSYLYSSFFFAPRCYCDPNSYLVDDDLAKKTVDAHKFVNSEEEDVGCPNSLVQKHIRADVLITSQIEKIWRNRNKKMLADVKWTYIGCRSGVFRTYPGHRSKRYYDPTKYASVKMI